MHGTEPCKYFFGIAKQINSDFDFAEILQIFSKITQYANALS
jgi:hypothetical protein